jgi:primosomal protein N' (replication factor Y) (superfamily II helicase)
MSHRLPMIADVVFDVPIDHPFSYRVPDGWMLRSGQRVLAPLRGAQRLGMVVALRTGPDEDLKPVRCIIEQDPVLAPAQLDLARWIARESLSSLGATCAALTPPVALEGARRPLQTSPSKRGEAARPLLDSPTAFSSTQGGEVRVKPDTGHRPPVLPSSSPAECELLVGPGRERRVLERVAAASSALLLASDIEGCARWAQRLEKIDRVARLDSGASAEERVSGWRKLGDGAVRLAVGTRSALLAPLPAGATIVMLDEHDSAHNPPGAPRIHARELVLERALRQGLTTLFTSATPSVEMWQRVEARNVALNAAPPSAWPKVAIADTRGILRREALTPLLAREIRETLAAGRRVFLGISRLASALACDECGVVVRCERCGLALAYSRTAATLVCRLCSATVPLSNRCPACQGHRLSPFGWGAERVEHAVRRRFARARVARYDPTTRGARAQTQRAAAAAADVVIGTRGALRLFGPASLGLAAFVSPDQLLRLPDFRAGEQAFAWIWAAAERVRADGRIIIQSQNPSHYVFDAVARGDLVSFYRHELEFRRELGYPPFRRLAVITMRGRTAEESLSLANRLVAALSGVGSLTVYPPPPGAARARARQVVVKGGPDLPGLLRAGLGEFLPPAARARGIMDVEVDPVEWPS